MQVFYYTLEVLSMRAKPVPPDEQYRLIMECRSSGMTDCQWCMEHDIKPGTFYNWVKRLRQNGCADIPKAAGRMPSGRQDVVRIDFTEPSSQVPGISQTSGTICWSSPSPSVVPVLELLTADAVVRVPQGTDPSFLEQVIRILGGIPC